MEYSSESVKQRPPESFHSSAGNVHFLAEPQDGTSPTSVLGSGSALCFEAFPQQLPPEQGLCVINACELFQAYLC